MSFWARMAILVMCKAFPVIHAKSSRRSQMLLHRMPTLAHAEKFSRRYSPHKVLASFKAQSHEGAHRLILCAIEVS